ncbi:hypothetical protein TIFTF001_019196 [Ficus carica]|uniref:Uncharacterized protein n=1 Tax=Ficus carica TaxID=3494 RepID=A0AA88A610_FICCA|nr:hypothetical protein TIFTF001_019196 [Ficus carica]
MLRNRRMATSSRWVRLSSATKLMAEKREREREGKRKKEKTMGGLLF